MAEEAKTAASELSGTGNFIHTAIQEDLGDNLTKSILGSHQSPTDIFILAMPKAFA